ncbi:hypothetical protein BGZ73_006211 [Actinomortierella ambigua]|nr:hypothetical protein BGZ73_006211 [Actinomortierella ambigua]
MASTHPTPTYTQSHHSRTPSQLPPPSRRVFHGLPSELIQHIASFLSFEDLLRVYKSLPRHHRPVLQWMVDQVIALMVLQLEIHQARDDSAAAAAAATMTGPAGIGHMANRVLHRLLSLVVMEPSNLLAFGTGGQAGEEGEQEAPPLVPMANPDPGQVVAGAGAAAGAGAGVGGPGIAGIRPAATPVMHDATLNTSWRAVEFDKEQLRITFELEEKLELERTIRQHQPFMFLNKEDEGDGSRRQHANERAAGRSAGSASSGAKKRRSMRGTADSKEELHEEEDKEEDSYNKSQQGKRWSGLGPRSMEGKTAPEVHPGTAVSSATSVTLQKPTSSLAASTTSTAPRAKTGVDPSPFHGLCQSLLDTHLRDTSYFHCISTTQPAFLQSAKVVFRGSRSLAAPWIALPSTDPMSLWSRPRAHWSLSDIEDALLQQKRQEEEEDDDEQAIVPMSSSSAEAAASATASKYHHQRQHQHQHQHQSQLSKRAQDRVATFHQNRVLARFLGKAHGLGHRRHPRDGALLFSTSEFLPSRIPLQVTELCTKKTVEVTAVSAPLSPGSGAESGSIASGMAPAVVVVVDDQEQMPQDEEEEEEQLGEFDRDPADMMSWHAMDGHGNDGLNRRRKRDVLRQLLFGDANTMIGDQEGVAGAGTDISNSERFDAKATTCTTVPRTLLTVRTVREPWACSDNGSTRKRRRKGQSPRKTTTATSGLSDKKIDPLGSMTSSFTGCNHSLGDTPSSPTPKGRRRLSSLSLFSLTDRASTNTATTTATSGDASTSFVSGMAKRLFKSAHFLSNLATTSSSSSHNFQQSILARAFQGPAGALIDPCAFAREDDDSSEDDEDELAQIAVGTWDEGESSRQKGKGWVRQTEDEEEDNIEEEEEEEEEETQQPLFELEYGVGHNYMNAARLEGERVIRPIRFSCSLDFFVSSSVGVQ